MKIRTDFVTNSSSSNFTVSLVIKTKDGKTLVKDYGDDDPEFRSDVSVYGQIDDILKAVTVSDLMEKLQILGDDDDDNGYEDEDEYEEEDDYEEIDEIQQNPDAKLKTVTIKRYWKATGEWSSSFGYNVDKFLPELRGLCQKVLDTEGDEKEKAKADLEEYLNDVGKLEIVSGSGYWPSYMCYANGTNKINWKQITKDIEKLAECVVDDALLTSSDRGEEILKLDFVKKTVDASNIYYLEF